MLENMQNYTLKNCGVQALIRTNNYKETVLHCQVTPTNYSKQISELVVACHTLPFSYKGEYKRSSLSTSTQAVAEKTYQ